MSLARRTIGIVALPTVALGIALAVAPGRAEPEVHVWLLVVLGLTLLEWIGVVRAAYPRVPSPFAASLRRQDVASKRPESLVRTEREVSVASSSAFDVHRRLRPAVTELAAGLLVSRRGIDLEREPDRARAALGEDVWELVRPERAEPAEKLKGGIDEAHLDRIVTALERI